MAKAKTRHERMVERITKDVEARTGGDEKKASTRSTSTAKSDTSSKSNTSSGSPTKQESKSS